MEEEKDQENIDAPTTEPNSEPAPEQQTQEETPVSDVEAASQPDPEQTEEPEAFVDAPTTQPPLPENLQQSLDDQKNKEDKKSKKKLLFIVLAALLMIVGAAAYYFLVFSKAESNVQEAPQEEVAQNESYKALFYQTSSNIKFFNTESQSEINGITIPDGAEVLSVNDDASEVYYAVYSLLDSQSTDNSAANLTVFKATSAGEEQIFKSRNSTGSNDASPVISNDNSKLVYYGYPEGTTIESSNADTSKIFSAELDGSNKEIELIDGRDNTRNILIPVAWSQDNSSLFMQEYSCYGACGGAPSTANIWELSIADKELEEVFQSPENVSSIPAVISPDSKFLALSVTDNSVPGPSFEDLAKASFDVYTINLEDKTSKKLYSRVDAEETKTQSSSVAGWSQDSSDLIVGVFEATQDSTAPEGYKMTFIGFDVVAVTDGRISKIPVTVDSMDESHDISATTFDNTIFFGFSTISSSQEDGPADVTMSLLALPLGEGESEVKTIESALPKLKILGSGSVTSTQQ